MTQRLEEVSMRVTQADIDIYAELTDDFNPLHVDPAFAATTPMGGTIAHGTLSVNLIWQSLARSLGAAALARIDLDIRFLKPDAAEPDRYEVWVKGADGATLIAGHARLAPITD